MLLILQGRKKTSKHSFIYNPTVLPTASHLLQEPKDGEEQVWLAGRGGLLGELGRS